MRGVEESDILLMEEDEDRWPKEEATFFSQNKGVGQDRAPGDAEDISGRIFLRRVGRYADRDRKDFGEVTKMA